MAENHVDNDADVEDCGMSVDDEPSCRSDEDTCSLAGFEDDFDEDEFEENRDVHESASCTSATAEASNGKQPLRRKRKSVDPTKRKRIRRILREDELKDETISAQKEEKERLRRLELQRSVAAAASGSASGVKTSESGAPVGTGFGGSNPISPVAVNVREKRGEHPHVIVIDSDEEGEAETRKGDCSHRRPPSESSSGDLIEVISSDSEVEVRESDNDDDGSGDVDYDNSGVHVDDTANQVDVQGRVLVNVNHPAAEEDIFLAPQIVKVIKPHQIGGIRFLYDNLVETLARYNVSHGFGCILAHAMGLGKTLQVIGFVDVFLRHTSAKKILVVVPINTIQNWLAEFNMWLPPKPELIADRNGTPVEASDSNKMRYRDFEVFLLGDNQKTTLARAKVIGEWNQHGGVLLMGYELFRLLSMATPSMSSSKSIPTKKRKAVTLSDRMNGEPEVIDLDEEEKHMELLIGVQKALCRPGADLVICDEGHRIKNDQANTSQALKKVHTRRRVVLTGYPLQNNLQEYWCMVDFVRPNFLGTKQEFSNMFERPILNGQCTDSTPSDVRIMRYRAHVLHSLLEGFVQRRSQAVLKRCLPTKEEHIILVNLSPVQKELYDAFVKFLMNSVGHVNPVKGFHTCTKIWNHPDIFYRSLDIKSNGKGNESPLTILDDGSGEGLRSQNSKGKDDSGSGTNSTPVGSPHTEARNTFVLLSSPNHLLPTSPYFRTTSPRNIQNVRSSPLIHTAAQGPQQLAQTTSSITSEMSSYHLPRGSIPAPVMLPQASQGENDRPVMAAQPASTQSVGCSTEGRPFPISDMDWAEKIFKDYQLGMIENGGKLVVLIEIIKESLKLGEKILIFSQSLSTLSVIEEFLGKQDVPFFPGRVSNPLKPSRWARNKSYYRLDGSTAAQERERLINSFNAPDNTDVILFMLSTRAGCLGINLIGASRVVVFDASWNPCHDVQAVCRVYRYGQRKPVHIYRLISTGTMEKKIYDRQISKQGMADRVVDELNPEANFTKQEIMKLIWEKEPDCSVPDLLSAADKFSDPVLARLCRHCNRWVAKVPFKHDSLLVDRKELKLTKAEKREAKKGYEIEKRMATEGVRYFPGVIQPVRNHLLNQYKPAYPVKPVGLERLGQAPQGGTPSYTPQYNPSSFYVPLASLIRAGVNVAGRPSNVGGMPPPAASVNSLNSGVSVIRPQANQPTSSSNEKVVMIDLDDLPSPTKPEQPTESIDCFVRRARNAFPNVSPHLISYLLNQRSAGTSQGLAPAVYAVCSNDGEVCEVTHGAGANSATELDDPASNPEATPHIKHQTLKSVLVSSSSPRQEPQVLTSASPPTVQEVPPNVEHGPINVPTKGESSETSIVQSNAEQRPDNVPPQREASNTLTGVSNTEQGVDKVSPQGEANVTSTAKGKTTITMERIEPCNGEKG